MLRVGPGPGAAAPPGRHCHLAAPLPRAARPGPYRARRQPPRTALLPSLENNHELRGDSPEAAGEARDRVRVPSGVRQAPARSWSSPRLPLAPAQLRRCLWRRHVLIHAIPGVGSTREPKEESAPQLPPRRSLGRAMAVAAPPCSRQHSCRQQKPQLASPRRVALFARCLGHPCPLAEDRLNPGVQCGPLGCSTLRASWVNPHPQVKQRRCNDFTFHPLQRLLMRWKCQGRVGVGLRSRKAGQVGGTASTSLGTRQRANMASHQATPAVPPGIPVTWLGQPAGMGSSSSELVPGSICGFGS